MKSRMSSWASFFTLGGMSPSTYGEGEEAAIACVPSGESATAAWSRTPPMGRLQ